MDGTKENGPLDSSTGNEKSESLKWTPMKSQKTCASHGNTCSVCLKSFENSKILPCLHTFCENCLNNEIEKQTKKLILTTESFECPFCKESTRSPVPNRNPSEWACRLLTNSIFVPGSKVDCNPCETKNVKTAACGFCIDCRQLVCRTCVDLHKLFNIMKNHQIIEEGSVLKNVSFVSIYMLTSECEMHVANQCKLFCRDHSVLCCSSCKFQYCRCRAVPTLEDAALGIKTSPVIKKTEDMIEGLRSKLSQVKARVEESMQNIDRQKIEILESIKQLRVSINLTLDNLEKDVENELEKIHKSATSELNQYFEQCSKITAAIETSQKMFSGFIEIANETELFTYWMRISRQIKNYKQRLEEAMANTHLMKLHFQANDVISRTIRTADSLGTVDVFIIPLSGIHGLSSFIRRNAEFFTEFNAEVIADKRIYKITGTSFLPDGRVVIVDYGNRRVKRFSYDPKGRLEKIGNKIHTNYYTYVSSLKLMAGPEDVAVVSPSTLVLTLPEVQETAFTTVGETLALKEKIKTEGNYHSVACTEERLIVTLPSKRIPVLHVLDYKGTIVDRWYPRTGNVDPSVRFLAKPYYMKLDPDSQKLYISDLSNGIICKDMSGNTLFTFTDRRFRTIEGIAVHPQGNVFVSDYKQQAVFQMAPNGSAVGTLIGKEKRLHKPVSICYIGATNILLVSEQGRDSIKCFKVAS